MSSPKSEQTLFLEFIHFCGNYVWSRKTLEHYPGGIAEVYASLPADMDAICAKFVLTLAAQPLEKKSFTFPANWWEALKARWAPAWAQARWPVRVTTVGWDIHALAEKVRIRNLMGTGQIVVRELNREDYSSELGDFYD